MIQTEKKTQHTHFRSCFCHILQSTQNKTNMASNAVCVLLSNSLPAGVNSFMDMMYRARCKRVNTCFSPYSHWIHDTFAVKSFHREKES